MSNLKFCVQAGNESREFVCAGEALLWARLHVYFAPQYFQNYVNTLNSGVDMSYCYGYRSVEITCEEIE